MITKVRTVGVSAQDQDESVEFWVDKVGFSKRSDEPMGADLPGRWIELAPPAGGAIIVPFQAGIVFECDDIQRTFEELRDRGVEFTIEPARHDWGTFAQFKDPDGIEYGLVEA